MLPKPCAKLWIQHLTHNPVSIVVKRGLPGDKGEDPSSDNPHDLVRIMCGKTSSRDPIDDSAVKPATNTANPLSRSDPYLAT